MINHGIAPEDLKIIHDILRSHEHVYVFGSRVKGTYQKFSDIDICIKDPISDYEASMLEDAFTESDLPFKVDVVLYHQVTPEFQKRIDQEAITLDQLR